MRTGKWLLILLAVALVVFMAGAAGCDADNGADSENDQGVGTESDPGIDDEGEGVDEDVEGAGDNIITAADLEFSPEELTVGVGEVVTFKNVDSVDHDIEIDGENLGTLEPDDELTWTAEEEGSYPYVCTIHPEMEGTIIVE